VQLWFSHERRVRIAVGADPYREVLDAVEFYEAAGQAPVRLDAGDWVTMSGIADRVGRSRETVRLWTVDRLGPGRFPAPLNPGGDIRFFSWAEVLAWLHTHQLYPVEHSDPGGLGDEIGGEPVLAALNLAMQLRQLLPRLSRPEAVLALARPRARSMPAASGRRTRRP
jgi:hypothetical protein